MNNKNNISLILKIILLNMFCILGATIFAFESGLLKHKLYSSLKCTLKITNCYSSHPQSSSNTSSNTSLPAVAEKKTDIMPTKISYGPLGINLNIVSVNYDNNIKSWAVDSSRANIMAEQSKLFPASSKGQTFIYGHNSNNIFYFVNLLHIGDIVDIFDADNNQYSFKVTAIETMLPTSIDVLKYAGPYRLTLMTCTSFNDKDRKLVYLNPL